MSGDSKALALMWVCIAGQTVCFWANLAIAGFMFTGAILALYAGKIIGAYDTREHTKAAGVKPA